MCKATCFVILTTTVLVLSACNQPYAQQPSITNTPINPDSLFATPMAQTPSMSGVEVFGTGTALALTGTPVASIPTQTQLLTAGQTSTMVVLPTATLIPGIVQPEADVYRVEESVIQNLPKARFEYIVPADLKLNGTFMVELQMSRSLTESELSTQIVTASVLATSTSEPGTLVAPEGQTVILGGGQVEVTPFMQARLFSEDIQAFDIQPIHDNAIQVLDPNTTVKWQWLIKAKKYGKQGLIFVIYQQAKTNDEAHWHTLETERRVVEVNVTLDERLQSLNWEWITGAVIVLAAISALWYWFGQRKQRPEILEVAEQRQIGTPTLALGGSLGRLPRIASREETDSKDLGNIFISYRRSDSADITGRIYDRLIQHFGPDSIFKDVDSIPLGTDFRKYLDKKVSECEVLLAIIGDRWVEATDPTGMKRLDDHTDFVRVEIESALKREIPVIPLLVRGAQMPAEENLPFTLRRLVYQNGIQIRPDPDFHHDMDRLIAALDKYV